MLSEDAAQEFYGPGEKDKDSVKIQTWVAGAVALQSLRSGSTNSRRTPGLPQIGDTSRKVGQAKKVLVEADVGHRYRFDRHAHVIEHWP